MLLEIDPGLTVDYKVICLKGNTRLWSISYALTGCQIAQLWIFVGRTDAEAETPILWPPDAKNWFTVKTLMLGKIEGRRRRGWQRARWLDGITNSMDMSLSKLGDSEGQGSLACCGPRDHKESDTTEWLNNKGFGASGVCWAAVKSLTPLLCPVCTAQMWRMTFRSQSCHGKYLSNSLCSIECNVW